MRGRSERDEASDPDALVCASCGTPLSGDPDEDPTGDAGMPICGECERNRNFDAMLEHELLEDGGEG